jgi:hypothetical protein
MKPPMLKQIVLAASLSSPMKETMQLDDPEHKIESVAVVAVP